MANHPIALVTGANKGIGYQISDQFGALGMTVLVGARDAARGDAAVSALRAAGRIAYPVVLDVTDQASVDAAAKAIDSEFGRLDVLVNNAGVLGTPAQAPSTVAVADVHAVYETNVFGVLRVTAAMVPLLRRSARPRVVNQSSSVGSLTRITDPENPLSTGVPPSAAYATSKTALNSLTVQLARELRADGILVNASCPGYCATDLNGHTGFRTAAQGAAIAARLATLPDDGPTGGFFDDDGPVPW